MTATDTMHDVKDTGRAQKHPPTLDAYLRITSRTIASSHGSSNGTHALRVACFVLARLLERHPHSAQTGQSATDMGCRPPAAGREVGGASYLLAHPYYSRDRLVDDGHGLQTTQARRAVGGASYPLVHPYYSRDSHTRQSTTTTTTPTHFEADASYPPMNRLIADRSVDDGHGLQTTHPLTASAFSLSLRI
ncbi:hypothetical protein B0H34DRAFT_795248 [Crassisporium funariophilum]|nr:hypothetical protein B0H34DRAFT_795248 [Crassisporium funariophilum]